MQDTIVHLGEPDWSIDLNAPPPAHYPCMQGLFNQAVQNLPNTNQASQLAAIKMEMPSNLGFIPSRRELYSHLEDYMDSILDNFDSQMEQAYERHPEHPAFKILNALEDALARKEETHLSFLVTALCGQDFSILEPKDSGVLIFSKEDAEIRFKWNYNALADFYQKASHHKMQPEIKLSQYILNKSFSDVKFLDTLKATRLCQYEMSKFDQLIDFFWSPPLLNSLLEALNSPYLENAFLSCAILNNIITSKAKTAAQVQSCLNALSRLCQACPDANIKAWAHYFTQARLLRC